MPESAPPAALEVILNQRACRAFGSEPVDDADLHDILRAATHAPSAENAQPWVFVVVRDSDRRDAIAAITRQVWEGGGRGHAQRTLEPALFDEVDEFLGNGYGGAPVLVVVAGDGRAGTPRSLLASSVYPAIQNLLLAAAALGYGAAMTTIAAQDPDALAAAVELPELVVPFAVVPIGRPRRPLGPPRRRPVRDVAHRDRFGEPFLTPTTAPGEPPRPAPPRA